MPNAFVRKLDGLEALDAADREFLVGLMNVSHRVSADEDLIRVGDNPANVHVILEGFAVRYKLTAQGKRQIFAYLIPGDCCDLQVALLGRMDHSIGTITPCRIVELSPSTVHEITRTRPAVTRALWLASLVDEATLREWLLNLGQRSAQKRIAHLFCELHTRLKAVGLTADGSFELPLTQTELGDTMGLSTVHVNRSLKDLREANLVLMKPDQIFIPDVSRLAAYAGFDPSYLHLKRSTPRA